MKIALAALFAAAILLLATGPVFIPLLRRLKFGQTIRSDGPQRHLAKAGTPTMGGIMFLPAFLIAIFVFGDRSPALLILLFSFIGFGLIGCLDDGIKIVLRRSLGLRAWQKLVGQFAVILIVLFIAVNLMGRGTEIIIPLTDFKLELGWGYYILMAFFLVYMVNAVNLTDGLDGLASGVSFLVFLGYMLISLAAIKNPPIVGIDYLDLAVGAGAMAGVCLGFLFYNRYPAKVFMGDTGAFAIGGAVVALAVLSKTEIVLIVLGGVYMIEALSVVLQVFSFRVFGKRIFKMSPLHHHYEMKGWTEKKVVYVFWTVAAICVILGLVLVSI